MSTPSLTTTSFATESQCAPSDTNIGWERKEKDSEMYANSTKEDSKVPPLPHSLHTQKKKILNPPAGWCTAFLAPTAFGRRRGRRRRRRRKWGCRRVHHALFLEEDLGSAGGGGGSGGGDCEEQGGGGGCGLWKEGRRGAPPPPSELQFESGGLRGRTC